MTKVHALAQQGFNTDNELYDRARPSYQLFALEHIRNSIRTAPPLNIVEIGAGTGIFTRALLASPAWKDGISQLRAVEPSEGMRDVFQKSIQDDRVSVQHGTFDTTNVEDEWADLVVIAQAYHWCPDYGRASAEFARILKPKGTVAFIWNLEDREKARWVAQLRNRIEKHEAGSPQFRLELWRETFETSQYQQHFEGPEEKVWTYSIPETSEIAVDRASSKSYIAVLDPEEKASVREDIRAIVEKGEDLVWQDEAKGVFEYPYKCWVVIAQKK